MLERNRIYTLDCIEGMRRINDGVVDVIVTSPPYNIGAQYSKYVDKVPREKYLAFMWDVATHAHRILDEYGSFYLNVCGTLTDPWFPYDVANVFREQYVLQNVIHWIKSISIPRTDMGASAKRGCDSPTLSVGHYKPVNSNRYHHNCHEYIFHFTKNGDVAIDKLANGVPYQDKSNINRWEGANNKDLRDRGNAWFIPYATISKAREHPTIFPIALPLMCIKDHGLNKADLVVDPFMGIGTTAQACAVLGVDFIGFEIDEKYVEVANRRLQQMMVSDATSEMKMWGVGA